MKLGRKQEIKDAVMQRYAAIASNNSGAYCCETSGAQFGANQALSCCGQSDMHNEENPSESCSSVSQEAGVKEMPTIMGYTQENIKDVPEGANLGLGCGNPVALASLRPGETVVDLGSGGGFDCFLAAKAVGGSGEVIGVDMTPDMVSKARSNAEKIEADNVDFRLGEIENLPIADNTADIIMSNCVINLSPDKQNVYNEAFRVLKPGGRLAISDVLATAELPDNIKNDLALVGACVGGAATIEITKELLEEAGFEDVRIELNDHSQELIQAWAPGNSEKVTDYIFSAYIQAFKPTLPM